MYHGMGWGTWGFGWIIWIIVLVIIIWGIIKIVSSNSNKPQHHEEENALDILKKRYAKGEITKEQFEQIKKDLQ